MHTFGLFYIQIFLIKEGFNNLEEEYYVSRYLNEKEVVKDKHEEGTDKRNEENF
ncbi:hypothetical protein ACFVR1_04410 [Psychrobacillus sp. NPDC058041]|uniref:hypothetical protein n=1 Tax=Psychrobacillus sp. NPDC058041 TaxID=3346310 RepID=UPI0036D83CE9